SQALYLHAPQWRPLAAGPQQPVEGAPSVPTAISAKDIVSKRTGLCPAIRGGGETVADRRYRPPLLRMTHSRFLTTPVRDRALIEGSREGAEAAEMRNVKGSRLGVTT